MKSRSLETDIGLVATVELTASYEPSKLSSSASPPSDDKETEWKEEVDKVGA